MLISEISSAFKSRRSTLINKNAGAVFLLPGAREIFRNNDVAFPFRQESSVIYTTGYDEADAFAIIAPPTSQQSGKDHRLILFVRRRDAEKEMWEGERYGIEGAIKVFGADEAYPIDELEKRLPDYLKGVDKVYYRMNKGSLSVAASGHFDFTDSIVLRALESARKLQGRSGRGLAQISDPDEAIGELRLFKSEEEIKFMRKASLFTAQAHTEVMKQVKAGMNEFEVEALIDYEFRKRGCKRLGYNSIVAGGKNAACLHYHSNNEVLRDGDLLLIDAGGEFEYYTSDITRTFPIGKTFSKEQEKAYGLVLKAQKEAIEMVKPGAKIPAIHNRVCEVLTEGLLELGLLSGKCSELVMNGAFKRFYPHSTSHWLGMDVHDIGLYHRNGEPRELEAGMILTIEPGFYVQPSDAEVPTGYKNIGIRIEDDILVTATGYENLTSLAPKEITDIVELRK